MFILLSMIAGCLQGLLLYWAATEFASKRYEWQRPDKRTKEWVMASLLCATSAANVYLCTLLKSGGEMAIGLLLSTLLLLIAAIDMLTCRIPNVLLAAAAVILLVGRWIDGAPLAEYVLGGAIGFLLMLVLFLLAGGAFGAGDVKMMGLCGLLLGVYEIVQAILFTFVLGAVTAVFILVIQRTGRSAFPYGPVIAASTLASYYG